MNSNQIFSILSAGIAFTGIAAGFVEEMVFSWSYSKSVKKEMEY